MEYVDGRGLDSEGVAIPSCESITKKKTLHENLKSGPAELVRIFSSSLAFWSSTGLSTNCGRLHYYEYASRVRL